MREHGRPMDDMTSDITLIPLVISFARSRLRAPGLACATLRPMGRLCTLVLLGVSLLATSCTRAGVSDVGAGVTVVETPMSRDCEQLGVVHGESGGAGGVYLADEKLVEYALNDLRNRAGSMGATHVHAREPTLDELDGVTHRGLVDGTAYRCGPEARSVADAVAERIRRALDERRDAILACTARERVAVRVEYAPEPPLRIGLSGELADQPEEQCVVNALADLSVDVEDATGTVIHLVQRPEATGAAR